MKKDLFTSEASREKMEEWYRRFLKRSEVSAESAYLSTSFGESHLLLAGDPGNPPLVCLHAMMTSSAHLLSELASLTQRYRIIAPDLPGQSVRGLPLHLSYRDNSHARWLREVLDALNLGPAPLMGVSLGGFVARQFAASYPERTTRLVLLVPAGIVQGSVLSGLAKMLVPMMRYRFNPTEENLRRFTDPLITTWDEEWGYYLGDAFTAFKTNTRIPPTATDRELADLSVPSLVIAAEEDISFPGKPLLERVRQLVPQAETELLRGCRHSPPTTPEFRRWLSDRVIAFLESAGQDRPVLGGKK